MIVILTTPIKITPTIEIRAYDQGLLAIVP